jgi:hypothetical protein
MLLLALETVTCIEGNCAKLKLAAVDNNQRQQTVQIQPLYLHGGIEGMHI